MLRLSAFPRRIHTDSMIYRKNASTRCTVSAARITRARDMCRASLQRHRASILIQGSRSRRVVFICTTRLASRYGAFLIGSQVLLHCTKSNKSQVDVCGVHRVSSFSVALLKLQEQHALGISGSSGARARILFRVAI
jgi:hypothetical protein